MLQINEIKLQYRQFGFVLAHEALAYYKYYEFLQQSLNVFNYRMFYDTLIRATLSLCDNRFFFTLEAFIIDHSNRLRPPTYECNIVAILPF